MTSRAVFYRSLEWLVNTTPEFPFALCREEDPDLFFPAPSETEKANEAKRVCRACLHRTDCAAYAIANDINDGIFGGLTPMQRAILRRRGVGA